MGVGGLSSRASLRERRVSGGREEGFVKDAERWRKHRRLTAAVPSQEFVLPEVHSLYDVPAVVEHPPDVLCVHGAGEVWVAVMSAVAARSADPLGEGQTRGQT